MNAQEAWAMSLEAIERQNELLLNGIQKRVEELIRRTCLQGRMTANFFCPELEEPDRSAIVERLENEGYIVIESPKWMTIQWDRAR